jgi:hypothetical protein
MIRYTVLWSQDAEQELARIWCDYPDRRSVTNAADKIDAALREDAHQKGCRCRIRQVRSLPNQSRYFFESMKPIERYSSWVFKLRRAIDSLAHFRRLSLFAQDEVV